MKLKKPALLKPVEKETPKKEHKKKNLPPDSYKDEIEPIEFVVDENRKIVVSVKRGGELGLPCVDVRTYQTTDVYTGYTKKGINIPLENLNDLLYSLNAAKEHCDELGLFDEVYESEEEE